MQVLQSYPDYFNAHLDRSVLAEAGIEAVLFDEHTITNNWLYAQGLGGIKLMVAEADFLRAKDLLDEAHHNKNRHYDEVAPLNEKDEMEYDRNNKICPACGSRNTSALGYSRPAAFIGVLLWGFPIVSKMDRWHCFHCGKQFKA